MGRLLQWLFGLENVQALRSTDITFSEPWAASAPAWVLFGCVLLAVLGLVSYMRFEPHAKRRRVLMAVLRAAILAMLFFVAADPILKVTTLERPKPLLYMVFDGTESMSIHDRFSAEEEKALREATGLESAPTNQPPTRMDYLKSLLARPDDNLVDRLGKLCRLRAFVVDRQGIRSIRMTDKEDGKPDGAFIADTLDATAPVTPLGKAIQDLASRHRQESLMGVVMFSDFNKNSGPDPGAPAGRLGARIYTVGFGPAATKDLSVNLSAAPVMKKAERDTIIVSVNQSQLDGQSAQVRLVAEPLDDNPALGAQSLTIGERSVTLDNAQTVVEFPFVPEATGRFRLVARVEPLDGESVADNNSAQRELNIRDDFMRLLYVAFEPNWEWRFMKEVFHRDKLVGMRGFRTFLFSSDPDVRRTNPLFTERMDVRRGDFFATDVIFLGDCPADMLTPRFCDMVKEFVGRFGGGLVVIAGPTYGPVELADTPLAEMLPVEFDPRARRQDRGAFRLQLTPAANDFGFMQLGSDEESNAKAWANMGALPWYQPTHKVHPLAKVLAVHPEDTCADDRTPQPMIAVRRYGKGEVVYLAFDETWRLRRLYGERFYRQFWGQMIYRLGLGHATGSQKRFIVQTDRARYRVDDELRLTVAAYDEEFRPLTRDRLPGRKLEAELIRTDPDGKTLPSRPLSIPIAREEQGEFELVLPLLEAGDYRVRVKDEIAGEYSEVVFSVTSLSAERQNAVRNVSLEQDLARATGGKVFDLTTVDSLPSQIELADVEKISTHVFSLASTWFCFGLLVILAAAEWSVRKWSNVP